MTAKKPPVPDLSPAQRRLLRKLLADPNYLPQKGRTTLTKDVCIRKGVLKSKGKRLVPLWNPDTKEWLK